MPHEGEPAIAAEAWLLRHRDIDADNARVLAGATTPSTDRMPEDRCTVVRRDSLLDGALAVASADSRVQLLDAGELVIQAAGRTMRLVPRYMPDIMPFVVGVLYDAESVPAAVDVPLELSGGGSALVSAFGGEDVGHFDVPVDIPAPPRLTLAGESDATPVVVDRAAGFDVRWEAYAPSSDDLFAVVLSWTENGGGELRCRAGNQHPGEMILSRGDLQALPEHAELQVAVERTVRVRFSAAGLDPDSGEIELVLRDVAAGRTP